MEPFEIKAADVLREARKAFKEGRLQAQNVEDAVSRSSLPCLYSGPCAIGAALTPEQAEWLDKGGNDVCSDTGIASLDNNGSITTDHYDILSALQDAHDMWVRGESCSITFERVLTAQEAEYAKLQAEG